MTARSLGRPIRLAPKEQTKCSLRRVLKPAAAEATQTMARPRRGKGPRKRFPEPGGGPNNDERMGCHSLNCSAGSRSGEIPRWLLRVSQSAGNDTICLGQGGAWPPGARPGPCHLLFLPGPRWAQRSSACLPHFRWQAAALRPYAVLVLMFAPLRDVCEDDVAALRPAWSLSMRPGTMPAC